MRRTGFTMSDPNYPHMFLSISEVRRPLVRSGTTAIVVTNQCRFDLFAQSLLSLFMRTEPYEYLDNVIVVINGPRITSEQRLHDAKQAFLTDLSRAEYRGRSLPLAVFRFYGTGGALNHSNTLDAVMPFITTEHVLSMHDDVIVNDSTWSKAVQSEFVDNNVAMVACPHLLMCRCQETSPPGDRSQRVLLVPHPNTCFLSTRTELYFSLWTRWLGYCSTLPEPQTIDQLCPDKQAMIDFYALNGVTVEDKVLDIEAAPFRVVGHDVGAWYLQRLYSAGYRATAISPHYVTHIVSASWHPPADVDARLKGEFRLPIASIERDIVAEPAFRHIYAKHMQANGYLG